MSVLDVNINHDKVVFDNWLSNTFTCEYWGEWGENGYLPKGKYHLYYDSDISGRNFEICWYPKGELFKNPRNNTVKRLRQSIAIVWCRLGDYEDSMSGYHYIEIELDDLYKLAQELKNFNFNPSNYKVYR